MLVDAEKEEYMFISTNLQDSTCKFGGSKHGSKFLMENKIIVQQFFLFCKDNLKENVTMNEEVEKELESSGPNTRRRAAKRKAYSDEQFLTSKKIQKHEKLKTNSSKLQPPKVVGKRGAENKRRKKKNVTEKESSNPSQDLKVILQDLKELACESMSSPTKLQKREQKQKLEQKDKELGKTSDKRNCPKDMKQKDKELGRTSDKRNCLNDMKALEESDKDEIDEDFSDDYDSDESDGESINVNNEVNPILPASKKVKAVTSQPSKTINKKVTHTVHDCIPNSKTPLTSKNVNLQSSKKITDTEVLQAKPKNINLQPSKKVDPNKDTSTEVYQALPKSIIITPQISEKVTESPEKNSNTEVLPKSISITLQLSKNINQSPDKVGKTEVIQAKPKTTSIKQQPTDHNLPKETVGRSERITVSCQECGKKMPVKSLPRHLNMIHGKQTNLEYKNKDGKDKKSDRMVVKNQFQAVVKLEPEQVIYVCSLCKQILQSQDALEIHMRNHNQSEAVSTKGDTNVKEDQESSDALEESSSSQNSPRKLSSSQNSPKKLSSSQNPPKKSSSSQYSPKKPISNENSMEKPTANQDSPEKPSENKDTCTLEEKSRTVCKTTLETGKSKNKSLPTSKESNKTCEDSLPDQEKFYITCKECGVSIHQEYYAQHLRSVHKALNAFKCKKCGKGFNSSFSLGKHQRDCIVLDTITVKTEEDIETNGILDKTDETIEVEQTLEKKDTAATNDFPFTCSLCLKKLKSQKSLDSHMKIHEKDENLTCKICGKKFITGYRLRIHEGTHATEKKYKCPLCPARFPIGGRVISHIRAVHNDHRVACSKCCLLFDSAYDKNQHDMMEHNQDKCHNFICKKCGRGYETVQRLTEHNKAVHKGTEIICRVCGDLFQTKDELQNHMSSHNEEADALKCNICKLEFPTIDDLRTHKEKEHNSATICCETCGDIFPTSLHYKKHQLYVHQTEFPYKCEYCGKGFKEKKRCTQHQRVIHEQIGPFQCEECGLCVKSKFTLQNHMLLHQKECPHPCQYCPNKFRSIAGLQDHILAKHRSQINLKKFRYRVHSCQFCDFKTVNHVIHMRHERGHTGYRPYSCQFCEKKFVIEGQLKRHVRSKHDASAKIFSCSHCNRHYSEKAHLERHCASKKHQINVKIAKGETIPKDLVRRVSSKPVASRITSGEGKKKTEDVNIVLTDETCHIQSSAITTAEETVSTIGEIQYTTEIVEEQNLPIGDQEFYVIEEANETDLASMINIQDLPIQVRDGCTFYIISDGNDAPAVDQ